jgi:hypothetical protein
MTDTISREHRKAKAEIELIADILQNEGKISLQTRGVILKTINRIVDNPIELLMDAVGKPPIHITCAGVESYIQVIEVSKPKQ